MFKDIKQNMDTPTVHRIISYASFDSTPTGIQKVVNKYRNSDNLHFYAWIKNEEVLGICGFEEHLDKIEVHLISVDEDVRGKGIGRKMIIQLQEMYNKDIEAETDDDAIDFYRKCGFDVNSFTHPKKGKRWTCILRKQSW